MVVFEKVKKEDLMKLGFSEEKIKTIYEELRLKKGNVSLVLYTSGKLLIQGTERAVKMVEKELEKVGIGEKMKKAEFRKEEGWIIGTDESLKGDTFGGLIVAGVKADNNIRKKLLELGVADSKKLADKEILVMAGKIKMVAPCEIKSILPEEYNQNGEVTKLLNKMHQECANYLLPGKHVVDKYPGCNVGEIQEVRAESKFIEVAAASVLARSTALKQLDYLTVEAGFKLPKGSTHVKWALNEMKEKRMDFDKFVKTSFKNVKEFL